MSPKTETIEKRLLIWLLLVIAILSVIVAYAIENSRQSIEKSDWVNHTHARILEADGIVSSLNSYEAAVARFVVTGGARERATADAALGDLREHLQVAAVLSQPDELARLRIDGIQKLVGQRIVFVQQVLDARQKNGFDAARTLLASTDDSRVRQQILAAVSKLKEEENGLLFKRERTFESSTRRTRMILFGGLGLDFILLGLVFWLVKMDLKIRREHATWLLQTNQMLETKVQERTAELVQTNERLQLENLERQWGQEAIARVSRHNQAIINSVSETVLVISRGGNIIETNPAAELLSGFTASELSNMNIALLLREKRGEVRSWNDSSLADHLKRAAILAPGPGFAVRKDGFEVAVRFSSRPIEDRGKVVGAVLTIVQI